MEKDIYANTSRKKAGVALLTLVTVGFRANIITRDKKDHFIKIKGSIPQEGITILNVYAPNKHNFEIGEVKLHEILGS